jgi:hypothetical protein
MDLRLLGAFAAAPPASIVLPARRLAMVGFALMLVTGTVLFTAEASHVAMNRVFQIKASLIALGLLNALLVNRPLHAAIKSAPAFAPLPARIRVSALLSLCVWFCVAACGRMIAYF